MSGSLASAKAKRAGIAPPPPNASSRVPPSPSQPSSPQGGGVRMSVPQVLAMFDSRLNKLEAAAKGPVSTRATPEVDRSVLDDMESKFMMLAEEITTMKDVIMKLQAFTMDVNKTLFEERIQIMSDMNEGIKTQPVEESIQIEKISDSALI
jgi:hypothetical protein